MREKLTAAEMGRMSVTEYHEADKLPLVVVLDNVRSQHNVGAVFRTADAMRIERVVLCGICCCPPNQEIHKTALVDTAGGNGKAHTNCNHQQYDIQQPSVYFKKPTGQFAFFRTFEHLTNPLCEF